MGSPTKKRGFFCAHEFFFEPRWSHSLPLAKAVDRRVNAEELTWQAFAKAEFSAIKWCRRLEERGSLAEKPGRRLVASLLEAHVNRLLAFVERRHARRDSRATPPPNLGGRSSRGVTAYNQYAIFIYPTRVSTV
jgi:hypothetical protein